MSEKPESISGGCLCEAVRYTVKFAPDHDFPGSCNTCQCEQCRKQTGSLIFRVHHIPLSSLTLTDPSSKIRRFQATPGISRGFCSDCGSLVFWQDEASGTGGDKGDVAMIYMTLGCVDKADLKRYGESLATARTHLWCMDEVKGVTDHLEGKRWRYDSMGEGAALME